MDLSFNEITDILVTRGFTFDVDIRGNSVVRFKSGNIALMFNGGFKPWTVYSDAAKAAFSFGNSSTYLCGLEYLIEILETY